MLPKILIDYAEEIKDAIISSELFDTDLQGACGIASLELFKFAQQNNINLEFCYVGNALSGCHCFNLYQDSILDITAGQFDRQYKGKLAILPETEAKARSFWRYSHKASNLSEFAAIDIKFIQFETWYSQNPYRYSFTRNKEDKLTFSS